MCAVFLELRKFSSYVLANKYYMQHIQGSNKVGISRDKRGKSRDWERTTRAGSSWPDTLLGHVTSRPPNQTQNLPSPATLLHFTTIYLSSVKAATSYSSVNC